MSETRRAVPGSVETDSNIVDFESQKRRLKLIDERTRRGLPMRTKLLLAAASVISLGSFAFYLNTQTRLGSYVSDFGDQQATELGYFKSPDFTPIDGATPERMITRDWARVRKESTMNDDVVLGWSTPGQIIEATLGTGAIYEPSDGNTKVVNGFKEGFWYKVDRIQLFDEVDGKFVPRLNPDGSAIYANNVYIAAPFARHLTDEEKQAMPVR